MQSWTDMAENYRRNAEYAHRKMREFSKYPSSAVAYAWFVWEKGFKGDPITRWIN